MKDPIRYDNYFYSVLGLVDIQNGACRADLDMYAGCSHTRPL